MADKVASMNMALVKCVPKPLRSAIHRLLERRSLHMSQAGQDYWVYSEVFNEAKGKYFIDIGAHNGIRLSNTYILEHQYDWNGVCIEANPENFEALKKNRRSMCLNVCLDAVEGVVDFAKKGALSGIISPGTNSRESSEIVQIKTQTLNDLLKEISAPHEIDYLSIDVEGAEERVLRGVSFKEYRFNCMTVERPSRSLRKILVDNAYVLIKEIPGLDCFYVHRSFLRTYCANLRSFHRKKYLKIRWRR